MKKIYELDFYGKKLSFEIGRVAKQANAAVLARHGDTVILVTTVLAEKAREGLDFFPLLVDYEERYYAAGKVPGGFIKREGRPTEKATLTCRLIDRPLRPLFPKGMRNDVQVVATCLSVDKDIPPEVPAMIGSSAALSVSDIPWGGPTGTVVVGCVDGELVLCPDAAQREKEATRQRAEAQRIQIETQAAAEAEKTRLQGEGQANYRREIANGIVDQIKSLQAVGMDINNVNNVVLFNQYLDVMRSLSESSNAKTVVLPASTPGGYQDLYEQVTKAMLTAGETK